MPALTTTADGFLLRGGPRIISGALRRFRVHPGEWADRLREARLTGLKTVETYVPWNPHRPEPGVGLVLDGLPDLPRHLELAAVQALPALRGHTAAIAVQRDNEYAAFGIDTASPNHLEQALRSHGVEKLLFTCDRPEAVHLAAGSLPGTLAAGNFGGRIVDSLRRLRAHRGEGPPLCAEFLGRRFDHRGGPHHGRDAESVAADLDALLAAGASVNIHMFHGATSFGLTSGASHEHAYASAVTSHDCDAPLSESGDPTPEYHALRRVIARHAPVPAERPPAPVAKLPPAEVVLDRAAPLLPHTAGPAAGPSVRSDDPAPPDGLGGRGAGFAHCRAAAPRAGAVAEVLVESSDRVNYGPHTGDAKGLLGPVLLDGERVRGRGSSALPLAEAPPPPPYARTDAGPSAGPVEQRGPFKVAEPANSFLALPSETKGQASENGFLLDRCWSRGPQRSPYVPAAVLRTGANDLVGPELHAAKGEPAHLTHVPDLGPAA